MRRAKRVGARQDTRPSSLTVRRCQCRSKGLSSSGGRGVLNPHPCLPNLIRVDFAKGNLSPVNPAADTREGALEAHDQQVIGNDHPTCCDDPTFEPTSSACMKANSPEAPISCASRFARDTIGIHRNALKTKAPKSTTPTKAKNKALGSGTPCIGGRIKHASPAIAAVADTTLRPSDVVGPY